jgi:hypothetical protein
MNQPVTGPEIAYLADLTSARHLLNYVLHDDEITAMFRVTDPALKLEDVAAAFMNGDETLVGDWYLAGMLDDTYPDDLDAACMTIRVEPFYVYQLTGGKYE